MHEFHKEVAELLAGYGPLWLVGGAVRDNLWGLDSRDLDLVSFLEPEQADRILREHGYEPRYLGAKFETLSLFRDEDKIDLVFTSDLAQDARRRDFTINAIFVKADSGEVYDPLQGKADLERKLLRTCDEAEIIFAQDPIRILRMVKLAVKYGLTIEENVWRQGKKSIQLLRETAKERVTAELAEMLVLPEAERAVNLLLELGYWDIFLPELARLKGIVQNKYHSLDVWDHTMAVFRNTPPDLYLRLAGLFHDLGKWETAGREYYLAGKLERGPEGYRIGGCRITGTRGKGELEYKLKPLLGKQVKLLGVRLDHYPEVIQFKRLLSGEQLPPGLTLVEEGKRHFLNHERESARLLADILKRYSFAMFFPGKGQKREQDLLTLVENHMQGTLAFMPEFNNQPVRRPLRERAAELAWKTCWNGREFELEKIQDFIHLWKADFEAGKVHSPEQTEMFAKVSQELQGVACWQKENLPLIQWESFQEFCSARGLKGERLGRLKNLVRAKAMQEMKTELSPEFLKKAYAQLK